MWTKSIAILNPYEAVCENRAKNSSKESTQESKNK